MANSTIRVPRAHLIMALCLPLAVLMGYFLAEPLEFSSVGLIFIVLGVLAIPLLMKWYHPLLIATWNACMIAPFIKGAPALWMLIAGVSLFIAVLNRAVDPDKHFQRVPAVTRPLVFFALVIVATAVVSGGIGLRIFGSARFGGKSYFELLVAIGGYFALTSERAPARRAWAYAALFFLPRLTSIMSTLIYAAGPHFYFLYAIFPSGTAADQLGSNDSIVLGESRLGGLGLAASGVYCYLMARHGLRAIFDLAKPWRLFFFLLSLGACAISGYRAELVLFGLTFVCVFWLEGLWRTRALPVLAGAAFVGALLVLPLAYKLPL